MVGRSWQKLPWKNCRQRFFNICNLYRNICKRVNMIVNCDFKGTVKEKWSGYRIKHENLRRWTIHIRHISDVPVLRNWYKTVPNLTEIYTYEILYKSRKLKQIIFSKYANNLKTIISNRNMRISGLLPL